MESIKYAPIGIFDSGVGGLTILNAIHQDLPSENLLYIADQANVPYGSKSLAQVRAYSKGVTQHLLDQGAKVIIVACNTASAAALQFLRKTFPKISFVGMEPAIKPAANFTQTGAVGILATPATFQGDLYASLIDRFAQNIKVIPHTCPGLVGEIEAARLDSPRTRRILETALTPMLAQNIDTLVLGCTHYPFVIPLIKQIVGPDVKVIDPAPAIARQTRRILAAQNLFHPQEKSGRIQILTTGEPGKLQQILPRLTKKISLPHSLRWQGESLI